MLALDQKSFVMALAFVAVAANQTKQTISVNDNQVLKFVGYIEQFLRTYHKDSLVDCSEEKDAKRIDSIIQTHLEELRTNESTVLPVDREVLVKIFDRLSLRRVRRSHWEIYASASIDELQDSVLSYLDEEIKAEGRI